MPPRLILDWFWKGWFYTTDNCDQSIDQVKWYKMRKEKHGVEKKEVESKKGDLVGKTKRRRISKF